MPLLYDFGGFPDELYRIQYPSPGDPGLAARIAGVLLAGDQDTTFDTVRGLDHGAWVPARLAWPEAKLPVLEVSMPFLDPPQLFQLGRALRPLRDDGVLVVGSGGIVHNLSRVRFADKNAPVDEWAAEFDAWVAEQVEKREIGKLYEYRRSAPHGRLSVPTTEHFDPLFVVMGAAWPDDPVWRRSSPDSITGISPCAAFAWGDTAWHKISSACWACSPCWGARSTPRNPNGTGARRPSSPTPCGSGASAATPG